MPADDPFGNVETQPQVIPALPGAIARQRVEDLMELALGNRGARVVNREHDLGRLALGRNRDGGLVRPMVDRIADQIAQHLAHPGLVPFPLELPTELQPQIDLGLRGLDLFDSLSDTLGQIHFRRLDRNRGPEAAAGKVEQVVDHSGHAAAAADDQCGHLLRGCQIFDLQRELRRRDDRSQRCAQVVLEDPEKSLFGPVDLLAEAGRRLCESLVDGFAEPDQVLHLSRVQSALISGP